MVFADGRRRMASGRRSMSEQNVAAVRGLYEAFNRGDLEYFEQAISRDLVWNEAENSLNCAGNPYRSFA
jgi:uncharacterized protein